MRNLKSQGTTLIKRALSGKTIEKGFYGASAIEGLFGTTKPANVGTTQEWFEEFHKNPRLASVNKVAADNGVAEFGIYVDTETGTKRVVNHPLEEEIRNHSIPMFFSLWTAYRMMAGEVYIAYRLKDGMPRDFKLFAPQHIVSETENFYEFRLGEEVLRYNKSNVIKDLDLDLNDPYERGKGRMTALSDEIELDNWIVRYMKAFYVNSAQPAMFIIPKGEQGPDDKDLERLTDSLRTSHKGIGNSGKTAVLSFDADIASVPNNHRDMELLETRKALRDAGIQHIGVPPEIMGIVENSNKATVVAAEHIYAKQVRMPMLHHFEDIINSKILPLYTGSEDFYFKFSDILPDDEEMSISKAKEGREAGSVTINEHRAFLGLPPLKGDDGKYLVGRIPDVEESTDEEGYEGRNEDYETPDANSGENEDSMSEEEEETPPKKEPKKEEGKNPYIVEIAEEEVDYEEVDYNDSRDKVVAKILSGGTVSSLNEEVVIVEEEDR